MLNTLKKTAFIMAAAVIVAFAGVSESSAQGVAKAATQTAVAGNAEAGAKKNSACVGCHGIPDYKTAFPVVYRVPKIAGQNEKYIQSALLAYRTGERSHPSMKGIAASLSDQDIADLAAYYANRK